MGFVEDQLVTMKAEMVSGRHAHPLVSDARPTDDCYGLGIKISGTAKKEIGRDRCRSEMEHLVGDSTLR